MATSAKLDLPSEQLPAGPALVAPADIDIRRVGRGLPRVEAPEGSAFALTTRLEEQIGRFRDERINALKSGSDGRLIPPPGPTVVVHVVPFESFRLGFAKDGVAGWRGKSCCDECSLMGHEGSLDSTSDG
jgi:hypothetical protein